MGWPVVVVQGSGGTADAVAFVCARENRGIFVPNPKLMEIARLGNVEAVNIQEVDGKILQAMLERLFTTMLVHGESEIVQNVDASPNLLGAWDYHLTYRVNSKKFARYVMTHCIYTTLTLTLNHNPNPSPNTFWGTGVFFGTRAGTRGH